jgi:hypothetical protein
MTTQQCGINLNRHNHSNRHHCVVMQPSTPIRPVSGTFFEAVQVLRPHPNVRPVSAPAPAAHARQAATPDTDRCSVPSGTTIVDRSESPHLYTSRRQYEVATSRTLGSLARLETNVPLTPGSVSPTFHSLSPKSLVGRAKELLTPRLSKTPHTPYREKVHGAFCRTKSAVKSLRQGSREVVNEKGSRDSLRSGYYSVSRERLFDGLDGESQGAKTSIIADEAPQIAPLRPVSKFLPDLMIFVPENVISSEVVVEHNSIRAGEEADDEQSSDDSVRVAPLRLRSPTAISVSKDETTTAETSFYTAGETFFYYTPTSKEEEDVFASSNETSETRRPMTNFMAKLQDAMDPDRGYKTPSIVSSEDGSPPDTPSPSPKIRHTALNSMPRMQPDSLRAQYSKAEPASPSLTEGIPKMWQFNRKESTRELRIAPSVEQGLHVDNLKVFEEDATAEAAPMVHVEPYVINIRRSQALEKLESRELDSPDGELSDSDLIPAPLALKPRPVRSKSPLRSPSGIGPDYDVSTMPVEILHTIVFSAAYGDKECTELASKLYKTLMGSGSVVTGCEWDGRKQRLLLQSHLLEELKILTQYGFMSDEDFGVIRGQIFPTGTAKIRSNEDFTNYIRRAVSGHRLAEERAEEILRLAIDDEDHEFMQTSPEDEVFFQREPFNEEGFVYDATSPDEHYEGLRSLASTAGTFEEWSQLPESEPEPRWIRPWWRSPFLSKMARLLRIGYRKPMV